MMKNSYESEAKILSSIIDLAIEAIVKYRPVGYGETHVDHFVNFYRNEKRKILNPEPRYKTMKSLSISKSEALTFFQEGSGKAVDFFWEEIKAREIPIKRENKLIKVLKRKRIKDRTEYDFIIDVLVPYQREGLINEVEVSLINQMISEYEAKNGNKKNH